MDETFETLVLLRKNGAKMSKLFDVLKASKHSGYSVAEDNSLVVVYYPSGVIVCDCTGPNKFATI